MAATSELFREQPYATECEATVISVGSEGIALDQTPFYPTGGGQPGDTGTLTLADGSELSIVDCRKSPLDGAPCHIPQEGARLPAEGERVTARINWSRRHRHMRMHTCLHLLCTLIDGEVTGGSISDVKGRLDFDLPENTLDKAELDAALKALVAADHPIVTRWISDAELAAQPELVRTMSAKPPTGRGQVRLVHIKGVDLQPCGGTHVASTGEIGAVRIGKIEKKGRQNRRVNVLFDD